MFLMLRFSANAQRSTMAAHASASGPSSSLTCTGAVRAFFAALCSAARLRCCWSSSARLASRCSATARGGGIASGARADACRCTAYGGTSRANATTRWTL